MPLDPIALPLHFNTPNNQRAHVLRLVAEIERAMDLPVGSPAIAGAWSNPDIKPVTPPEPARPKSIALVVGHNIQRQGAYSTHLQTTEFEFWGKRADDLADALDFTTEVFFRKPHGSDYEAEMREVAGRVSMYRPDAVFCLHFNSFHDEGAGGAEALVLDRMKASPECRAAMLWLNSWTGATGLERRDVKEPNRGRYGMERLSEIAPTILLEPFFGSSRRDCDAVNTLGDRFVRGMADAITAAMEEL